MKRSFWKLVLLNFEEASHETIILETFSVKIVGSIVRNARFGSLFSLKIGGSLAGNVLFGSLFCESSRKHRTKRSFWKLFL